MTAFGDPLQATPLNVVEPPLEPVVFGAPYIGEEEIQEVVDTLRSGWIGTGPKTRAFEERFAEFVDARFAVATNSATAALHLSLDAVGVGPGDEVITTPVTFVATANVIERCGAKAVFADVRAEDGNIDPDQAAARVTDRTKAIIPVHYAGALADVPAIRDRMPDIPIVVDAAHAVEGRYRDGSSSASHASCTAYSFYVTKNLVTGEGGMLVTEDERVAETARVRSLHGLDKDAWNRYSGGGYASYELEYPGFKYNMTDVQASLGLHQLARIRRALVRREEIWTRYNQAFADLEGVTIPPVARLGNGVGSHARHLYALWFDWEVLGFDRRALVTTLQAHGIGTGWHFKAVHLHRYYRERYGHRPGAFPVAERISDRTVSLPLSLSLDDADVERVIDAIRRVARRPR